jgi:hypothetical protein
LKYSLLNGMYEPNKKFDIIKNTIIFFMIQNLPLSSYALFKSRLFEIIKNMITIFIILNILLLNGVYEPSEKFQKI